MLNHKLHSLTSWLLMANWHTWLSSNHFLTRLILHQQHEFLLNPLVSNVVYMDNGKYIHLPYVWVCTDTYMYQYIYMRNKERTLSQKIKNLVVPIYTHTPQKSLDFRFWNHSLINRYVTLPSINFPCIITDLTNLKQLKQIRLKCLPTLEIFFKIKIGFQRFIF